MRSDFIQNTMLAKCYVKLNKNFEVRSMHVEVTTVWQQVVMQGELQCGPEIKNVNMRYMHVKVKHALSFSYNGSTSKQCFEGLHQWH